MKTIKKIPKNVERFKITMPIPKDIHDINRVFKNNGFELFIVGGAVRDFIMDKPIKDFDLVTNAMPDDVERILGENGFRTLGTGKSFGVINVFTDNDEFETATMREDVTNENGEQGRHPEVKLGATIETDVKRRDLTLNALFFDIEKSEIVDLVGGIEDIRNKVIRTVGNPKDRFGEDRLRILRAIRFATRLGVSLHKDIVDTLKEDASLEGISSERIRDEFLKAIKSAKDVTHLIGLLDDFKLFDFIFPNLTVGTFMLPDTKDHILLLAVMLRANSDVELAKVLNELSYSREEVKNIVGLKLMLYLRNDSAPLLKKNMLKLTVTDKQIKKFAKIMQLNMDLVKTFLKFELTVKGDDVMKEFNVTGKELGEKIMELEIENFNKLLFKDKRIFHE